MSNSAPKSDWIRMCLPIWVSVPITLMASMDAYQRGRSFADSRDLVFTIFCYCALGVALVVSGAMAWKSLRRVRKQYGACVARRLRLVLAAALLLSVLAVGLPGQSFEIGRSRAYAAIDLSRLVEECRRFEHASQLPGQEMFGLRSVIFPSDPLFKVVPVYIRNLKPRFVWRGNGLVVVQMSGGGVYLHEGMIVAPELPNDTFARICDAAGLKVISGQYPVCRYRCYDFRIARDALAEQAGLVH